jgi:hypothetical protein
MGGWFIVPLGLAQISIYHAWGLNLMMAGWTYHVQRTTKEDQESDTLLNGITMLFNGTFLTTMIYFHGYIISQYFM